jgi:LAO/AO transport system kinase
MHAYLPAQTLTFQQKHPLHQNRKKQLMSPAEYASGILRGDRVLLSQAITLVESSKPEHQELAQEILSNCRSLHPSSLIPHPSSLRIGISGAPGVGKSTFIEAFGSYLTGLGKKLAVLAVDPSSQVSKGSILGDKTRMSRLANDPNAFIRPSPAGDSLGGVASRTREAMLLCEYAGFDTIFVETVGVGQSETAVHGVVDFFLLLLLPGAGDELQGIKRGIVELADLLVVNKADGERLALAQEARREYARALHLYPPKESGWTPKALTCSAIEEKGLAEIWQQILDFQQLTNSSGWLPTHRKAQTKRWLFDLIEQGLRRKFFENEAVKSNLERIQRAVEAGDLPAPKGAEELLTLFQMN